jgi:hypothetical protein
MSVDPRARAARPPATRRASALRAVAVAIAYLAFAALPCTAAAGTYWWSGTPTAGSNGFAFTSADQPWWNPWGGHCESRGATIPAGNPCVFTWTVPAGLDARGGSISGTYKQANPAFEQRNVVECNGTTTLQGTAAVQSFTRSWPDMCGYLNLWLLTPSAATAVSAGSQYFTADSFGIELVDPTNPTIGIVSVPSGWRAPADACIRSALADSGSGLVAATATHVESGATLDSASWASASIVTGVTSAERSACVGARGTGVHTIRISAADRSGNGATRDQQVAVDASAPSIRPLTIDGEVVVDGFVVRGSRAGYRPAIEVGASDPHAGVAAVELRLDGAPVPLVDGAWHPDADLALGRHVLTVRATDAVGNAAASTTTIDVVDDVAPAFTIDAPGASGGNEPVLDLTARDDRSGIDPASWTVLVDGEVLAIGSATNRLLAPVGSLVDGPHEIRIRVADAAGNVATTDLTYLADSGDDLPELGAPTGMRVVRSPQRVEEGGNYRVVAIAARAGRPVDGTFELRSGDRVLASGSSTPTGVVDLAARIDVAAPLHLHAPAGSGIDAARITYEFVEAPPAVDPDPAPDGGGARPQLPGGTTTIVQLHPALGLPGAAAGAVAGGGPPRDVVYYVDGIAYWNGLPLAESGAPMDRTPPTWRLTLRAERAGSVRRAGRIALRLWTSELSVLTIEPAGAPRRVSANPRRTLRTIHVRYGARSALGRRIQRARPGSIVPVRMRVVATDRNENRSRPRWVTIRVRV